MKKIQVLCSTFLLCLCTVSVNAQKMNTLKGKVLSTLNTPIKGAVISVTGSEDVTTGEDGTFEINCKNLKDAQLSIWASGYYSVSQLLNNRSQVTIIMIPESQYKYNETKVLPFRISQNDESTSAENITKKDFMPASSKIDRALSGQIAGLQIVRNSGLPGEGSYMNMRGIRSFVGNNAPLIVINGVPFIPDTHDSQLLNGISYDIFHIVFFLAIISVLFQGTLLPIIAKKLGLVDSDENVLKTFNDYVDDSDMELIQITVPPNHHWISRQIMDIELPENSIIVTIERGETTIIPNGKTVIEEGDVVILNAKRTKYYDISLREIHINTHHPWRDKELKDLNLPKNNLIVMIKREGGTVIPRGNTMIKDKDIVLLRDI